MGVIGSILENSGVPGGGAIGSLVEGFMNTVNYDSNQFREQFPNPDFQALEYWRFCNMHAPKKVSGEESVWNAPNSINQFRDKWAQNFDRVRASGLAPFGTSQQGEFDAMSLGSWDANMNWVPPANDVVDGDGNVTSGDNKNISTGGIMVWPWQDGVWKMLQTWQKVAWIALGTGVVALLGFIGWLIFRKKKKKGGYYKPR